MDCGVERVELDRRPKGGLASQERQEMRAAVKRRERHNGRGVGAWLDLESLNGGGAG